jgi:superfamily II DNA/RNA helicase
VGRTARAGKEGTAVTLLRPPEVYHFRKMLRGVDNSFGRYF